MAGTQLPTKDAPKPLMQSPSSNKLYDILAEHFWKFFAMVTMIGVFYFSYKVFSEWEIIYYEALRIKEKFEDEDPDPYSLLAYDDEQSYPALVVLKKQSMSAVEGYVDTADEYFLILGTVYEMESRVERIYIPWKNIEYVKMNLKESGQ